MTMGPEPIKRILWMSVRRGTTDRVAQNSVATKRLPRARDQRRDLPLILAILVAEVLDEEPLLLPQLDPPIHNHAGDADQHARQPRRHRQPAEREERARV